MTPFSTLRQLGTLAAGLAISGTAVAQPSYVFSTFAGSPTFRFADGPAATAGLSMPKSVAVDTAGNLYIADYGSSVIRKITPAGVVTTLAGKAGVFGSVDATGSDARFGSLSGIAVDQGGNLYVSEGFTNAIRRISPDGKVTTYAGSGSAGSTDGGPTVARFRSPSGVAVDTAGNVYVADTGNSTVRKISSTGVVSTIAGLAGVPGDADGVGAAARFNTPYGIAVDAAGTLYVSDWNDDIIRQITPDGTVTTIAGRVGLAGFTDGIGAAARFGTPAMLATDSAGNVYVADRSTYLIRKLTKSGQTFAVTTLAGQPGIRGTSDGNGRAAHFYRPSGVAVDSGGNIYVADTFNCTIRKVDPAGNVTTIAGKSTAGSVDGMRANASFFTPSGLAANASGDVFVCEPSNHTIRKVAADGTVTTFAGAPLTQGSSDGAAANARFRYPYGLAFDAAGNLFVADSSNNTIRKITPQGSVSTAAGEALASGSADGVGTAARFSYPTDLAFDAKGNLWIADDLNSTIRCMSPDGTVTTVAGKAGVTGATDGPGAQARFSRPRGLAFDKAGNLYIADYDNDTIRMMTPAGVVSTFVGKPGVAGYTDGPLSTARLYGPIGLSFDPAGNLYVAEYDADQVRVITREGTVTTIGGYLFEGSSDGVRPNSTFWSPSGIVADAAGNVFVADSGNNTIRRGGAAGVSTPSSRLLNLSVRANLIADKPLMTGFVLSGTAKNVLVRAVGPGLRPYVGDAVLAGNPRLQLFDSSMNVEDSNEDWGGTSILTNAFASVGAFSLVPTSLDAATTRRMTGLHTAHVLSPSSGMIIVEAYDSESGTTSRLVNVSARYGIAGGDGGALVAGFVIDGSNQKTLLIRGIGPTLKAFGVSGTLEDPVLEIYTSAGQKIASNDDWDPGLSSTFVKFAFDMPAGSKDAALLISLPPGAYSAQVTGKNGGTGEGLVEIYEVAN